MKDITIIKITRVLTSAIFWLSIIVLYFKYREIPDEKIYATIAFYGACVAILEFPTGVFSDYYSQFKSYKFGLLIIGMSIFLAGFEWSYLGYMSLQFTAALGMAMTSGSDDAVLSTYSNDFAKDYKQVKIWSQIVLVIALALGGFMFKYNPSLPIFATGIPFMLGFLLLLFVKERKEDSKYKGNIFSKALTGIKIAFSTKILTLTIILGALIAGFNISFKYISNDLFLSVNIPEQFHGVIIAFVTVLSILGTMLFKNKNGKRNFFGIFLLPILLILLYFATSIPLVIIILSLMYLSRGLYETYFGIIINEQTPQSSKASVLFLKNLMVRAISSLYSLSVGFVLIKGEIKDVVLYTGIFFAFVMILAIFQYIALQKSSVSKVA